MSRKLTAIKKINKQSLWKIQTLEKQKNIPPNKICNKYTHRKLQKYKF